MATAGIRLYGPCYNMPYSAYVCTIDFPSIVHQTHYVQLLRPYCNSSSYHLPAASPPPIRSTV
eukprot:scaffold74185_cov24-Prasinocladus_malaysianus.AAC.4